MVHERYDGSEEHEESEYHFSDDHANYDMDIDGSAKDGTVVAAAPKESMAEKLKQHRRMLIGIVIFIVLLAIVYKLLVPSSTTTPVTEFSEQTTSTSSITGISKAKSDAAHNNPAPALQQPALAPAMTTTPQPAVASVPAQVAPAAPVLTASSVPQQPVAQPTNSSTAALAEVAANKNVLDRVATLEQENSAMMNLLQTQYTQKIAEAETQNAQLRTQVQDLTSRISSMEVAFRQLTKILRNIHNPSTGTSAPVSNVTNNSQPATAAQPKVSYTVQAIIPGRAWLKSEAGDTVTVAEGDLLKDVGRITKIDPYDGIVDIDTGSKIITLSYGVGGE